MSIKCGECGEYMGDVTRLTDDCPRMLCLNKECPRTGVKTPQAVTGDRIGLQVLQALGLPTKGVTSFSISFAPNELVIATVKVLVDKARLEHATETHLVHLRADPAVSEPESAPPETDAPVPFDRPMR